MAFQIEVDEGARIVRTRYSGDVTLDERLAVACQALAEAKRIGSHRILLDYRDAQSLSGDPESCQRIADHCTPQLPPDARLAYLLRYDHQLNESLEALVRSRGVQVARFTDAAEAVAWLTAPGRAESELPPEAELGRAFQLVADVVDPSAPVSPDQFAAIGELVRDLLAKGVDEPTVRHVAGRMWTAMRPPPGG